MPSATRRRALELLAAGGVASLAGCSVGPLHCEQGTQLELEAVSDETIVEQTDRTPEQLHPLATDLVTSAGPDGTATYHSANWVPEGGSFEPFHISPDGTRHHRYVRLDDSYYRIAVERARTGTTTEQQFVVRTSPTVNADAQSGDTVAFEDLPRHDRRVFLDLLGAVAGASLDDVGEFGRLWDVGYLREDHVASSLFVPEPAHDYVRYRDWFLELEPDGSDEGKRVDYEVSLAHVADSTAGFAEVVKETEGVVLDDLTADQRDVLSAAAGGRYRECEEYSRALLSIAERIQGARYAAYDGTWYEVRMMGWRGLRGV